MLVTEFNEIKGFSLKDIVEDTHKFKSFLMTIRNVIEFFQKQGKVFSNATGYFYQEISAFSHVNLARRNNRHYFYEASISFLSELGDKDFFIKSSIDIEQLEWKLTRQNTYDAFVVSRKNLNSKANQYKYVYELAYLPKLYKQKNFLIVYSNDFLSTNFRYEVNYNAYQHGVQGVSITKNVIASYKIVPNFSQFNDAILAASLNDFSLKWNLSPFDAIFFNKDAFEEFNKKIPLTLFNNKKNPEWIRNLISLKYDVQNNSQFKKEWTDFYSPWNYNEFWTKNPRGASFSLLEKKFISEKFDIKMPHYSNAVFAQGIDEYSGEITEQTFDENDFNATYDQYKVVDYGERRTLKVYKDMIDLAERFLDQNITRTELFPSINISDLKSDQVQAFLTILKNKVSVLYGHAGTGKTYLTSKLINQINAFSESYVFLAPTYRASEVAKEMGQSNLNNSVVQSVKWMRNIYENIIIDECSMISDDDWIKIFNYIEINSKKIKRVILLGDDGQLPPIHSIGFFETIIKISREKKCYVELKSNKRFSSELEKIVSTIRNKNLPKDFKNVKCFTSYSTLVSIINEDLKDYKLISPINDGIYGTRNLNQIKSKTSSFNKGENVCVNIDQPEFNGEIFNNKFLKIKDVIGNIIIFDFKLQPYNISAKHLFNCMRIGKDFFPTFELEDDVIPPFAKTECMTVHMAQGSTFEKVAFIIPVGRLVSWKMLYTAITRAKENFVVIHHNSARTEDVLF